jgi:hypothetical protein
MAINTSESTDRSLALKGYSIEVLPYKGVGKIPMWRLEDESEALGDDKKPRERQWVKCGPFRVDMIPRLRAKGFTDRPLEPPPVQEVKCDVCGFEAKSEFGLKSHMKKHKGESNQEDN